MHGIELWRRAIDLQMENIGPIVMSGKIMPKLHRNAKVEVAFGIENAFLHTHRTGDDPAVGSDNQAAATAIGIAQELLCLRAGLQQADHSLIDRAAGRYH